MWRKKNPRRSFKTNFWQNYDRKYMEKYHPKKYCSACNTEIKDGELCIIHRNLRKKT